MTTDADDGLLAVKELRPDAVLVDFRMPLVNGLGFLYRLRMVEGEQQTPVLVITGDLTVNEDADVTHSSFRNSAPCFVSSR